MDVSSYQQTVLRARRHSGELALDAIEMQVRAAACRHDLECSKAFVRAAARAARARAQRAGLEEPAGGATDLPRQRTA